VRLVSFIALLGTWPLIAERRSPSPSLDRLESTTHFNPELPVICHFSQGGNDLSCRWSQPSQRSYSSNPNIDIGVRYESRHQRNGRRSVLCHAAEKVNRDLTHDVVLVNQTTNQPWHSRRPEFVYDRLHRPFRGMHGIPRSQFALRQFLRVGVNWSLQQEGHNRRTKAHERTSRCVVQRYTVAEARNQLAHCGDSRGANLPQGINSSLSYQEVGVCDRDPQLRNRGRRRDAKLGSRLRCTVTLFCI